MKNRFRTVTLYPNFANRGGAQDMALRLGELLGDGSEPVVLTATPAGRITPHYRSKARFLGFTLHNILRLAGPHTLFMSHHRKYTSIMMILKALMPHRIHVIHVAHNRFDNLRRLTLFPRLTVAVSEGVRENLISYFRLPPERISVIYNGLPDRRTGSRKTERGNDRIEIILPGRICPVKQQVEIVRRTKGRLAPHIRISFAGEGCDAAALKSAIGDSPQYRCTGFIDMYESLGGFDYVMLFSQKEGLGMSLVEGCMFGKPLITNNIDSVTEVNEDGVTGYVFDDFDALVRGLNSLPRRDSAQYAAMSANARRKYEDKFTETEMVKRYEEVVRREMGAAAQPEDKM